MFCLCVGGIVRGVGVCVSVCMHASVCLHICACALLSVGLFTCLYELMNCCMRVYLRD